MLLRVLALCVGSAWASAVLNVPYHRQYTDYACGDASMEMTLHYFGTPDVDQRAIIDVLRTTEEEGTLTYDIVRGGHFSNLSASPVSTNYPDQAPKAGWSPYRQLGMGAFSRRSSVFNITGCWLDDLRTIIDSGVPVMVLMHYSDPNDDTDGHFRVVISYDDVANTYTLLDPWDRSNDDARYSKRRLSTSASTSARSLSPAPSGVSESDVQPRIVTYSAQDMCALWYLTEPNGDNVTYGPFFAAVAVPWTVALDLSVDDVTGNYTLRATVTYVMPAAFAHPDAQPAPVAKQCTATVALPPSLSLVSGPATVMLGSLLPGESTEVMWVVMEDPAFVPGPPTSITVEAEGLVSALVPEYAGYYPAYSYTDRIGGRAVLPY